MARDLVPKRAAVVPEAPPDVPPPPRCTVCGGIGWVNFDAAKPCRSIGEAIVGAAPCPARCESPLREILIAEIGFRDRTLACVDCGGVAKMHWGGDLVCQRCAFSRTDERWRAGKRVGGNSPVAADAGAG